MEEYLNTKESKYAFVSLAHLVLHLIFLCKATYKIFIVQHLNYIVIFIKLLDKFGD